MLLRRVRVDEKVPRRRALVLPLGGGEVLRHQVQRLPDVRPENARVRRRPRHHTSARSECPLNVICAVAAYDTPARG